MTLQTLYDYWGDSTCHTCSSAAAQKAQGGNQAAPQKAKRKLVLLIDPGKQTHVGCNPAAQNAQGGNQADRHKPQPARQDRGVIMGKGAGPHRPVRADVSYRDFATPDQRKPKEKKQLMHNTELDGANRLIPSWTAPIATLACGHTAVSFAGLSSGPANWADIYRERARAVPVLRPRTPG